MLASTAFGQFMKPELKEQLVLEVERFDGSDGLSQGLITTIVEDSNGFLWVGTKDGLNRYDGQDFTVYRYDESDSTTITGNYVVTVVMDSDQRLWVATRNGGICCFNPKTEKFLRYRNQNGSGNGTADMLYAMPKGGVIRTTVKGGLQTFGYLETDNGPEIVSTTTERIKAIEKDILKRTLSKPRKPRFKLDANENLWVNLGDSLLLYENFIASKKADSQAFENELASKREFFYNSMLLNQNGDEVYWYKDLMKEHVWKFNTIRQEFEPFVALPGSLVHQHVKFIDSKNRLWSWTPEGNLLQMDLNDATYVVYEVEWSRKTESLPYGVRWYEDRNGNIWMGSNGYGLFKISAVALNFKRLPIRVQGIVNNTQTMRAVKSDDHALFDSSLLKTWNKMVSHLKQKIATKELVFQLQFLYQEDDGNILILAHSGKRRESFIMQVDTANFHLQTLTSKHHSAEYWAHPMILDSDKAAWCPEKNGENGHHMFRLSLETNLVDSFKIPIECSWHEYTFVSDWHEDTVNRRMWFGTTCGLFCFDKKSESWTTYTHTDNDSTSISSDMILSVLPDPRDPSRKIWAGTEGSGLNLLDVETGRFTHFSTTNSSLPSDVINGILADKHQNLWISTNNGLSLFNLESNEFINYYRQDGISDNEFNRYEYSRSKLGEIYVGGIGGWMHFNPEAFYRDQRPSQLVLTGLKLWNKPIRSFGPNEKVKNRLAHGNRITLSHEDNMLGVSFALLDLTAPHRNQYEYQMEGLSDTWIDLGNSNEAVFTNLDPGDYTLSIKGRNSAGIWTEEPTVLLITVLPPWFATWWFRLIMFLALAGLLYGFYRYRLAHVLRLERTRNRIAQDLHDEIGSTISSITLFGTVVKNTMHRNPEKAEKILDRITTYSSRIGERMNDLVWSIKPDNDDFDQVISRMRAYAAAMAESKGIELSFQVDKKVESLSLDMEIRKNIYLIFKEAVNNAVKYAECTSLSMSMNLHSRQLELQVKDNGKGFDYEAALADKTAFGGNGLSGMKIRARDLKGNLEINTWPQKGTSITLKVKV